MADKLGKCVSDLDTAAGMLIVAAMKDPTVKKAMELVSGVSFEIGNLIDECEGGEES